MLGKGTNKLLGFAVVALVLGAGCGGEGNERDDEEAGESAETELTPFQLEHGIGPVTEPVVLGAVDPGRAAQGQGIFETKCSMCHKMDTTYVGPPLGEVTVRRSPAFILNMILNPQEMVEKHPVAKQLLAERMTFMPNQQLTDDDARAVLEYLRTQSRAAPR